MTLAIPSPATATPSPAEIIRKLVGKQPFEFATEDNTLTYEGIRSIRRYLADSLSTPEEPYPPDLPGDFDFSPMTNRGSLAKRISGWYFKNHKIRVDPSVLSEIGNIASRSQLKGHSYIIDFVDRFNWISGDFGDRNSCYWGSNSAAKTLLRKNGGLAIRFYDTNKRGVGRAWVVPLANGCVVSFNAYGQSLDLSAVAILLAKITDSSYAKIRLTNMDTEGGLLYINSGAGYLIGDATLINKVSRVDFGWNPKDVSIQYVTCSECGRDHDEESVYTLDGRRYCPRCWANRFFNCAICNERHLRSQRRAVDSSYVCENCFTQHCSTCSFCHVNYSMYDLVPVSGGNLSCTQCLVQGLATVCPHCGVVGFPENGCTCRDDEIAVSRDVLTNTPLFNVVHGSNSTRNTFWNAVGESMTHYGPYAYASTFNPHRHDYIDIRP